VVSIAAWVTLLGLMVVAVYVVCWGNGRFPAETLHASETNRVVTKNRDPDKKLLEIGLFLFSILFSLLSFSEK
jgi:hypothetical protein